MVLAMRQCGKRGTAGDRSRGCWEQMMALRRFRFAAGVCVLAAGLLMGGGAVAVADPSGSAAHGDDASGDQHSTGAKKPKDKPGATTSTTGSATTSKTGATTS